MSGKKMKFTTKVFIGLILGVIFGIVLPEYAPSLKIFGDLFMKAIKMVIIPLILLCVTAGVAQMGDIRTVGKVGISMLIFAAVTNFLSSLTGVMFGVIFNPAKGVIIPASLEGKFSADAPKASEIILSIIPDNIFQAFNTNNILAIIFFAMMLGVAIVMAGKKGKVLLDVVQSGSDVVGEIIEIVIKFTPYAVFCLLAVTVSKYGATILGSLAKFVVIIWIGTIFFGLVWSFIICTFVTKIPFIKFLKSTSEAFMMGLATCSSSATMPLNVTNTEKYLGIPREMGAMVIGTGTAIINGGSSFYKALGAYFIATLFGVTLTTSNLVMITVMSSFLITAGVPAAGTLGIAVILSSLGVPLEGIALLMGVDRLRDMISTGVNIVIHSLGATAVNTIAGKSLQQTNTESFT